MVVGAPHQISSNGLPGTAPDERIRLLRLLAVLRRTNSRRWTCWRQFSEGRAASRDQLVYRNQMSSMSIVLELDSQKRKPRRAKAAVLSNPTKSDSGIVTVCHCADPWET